MTIRPTRARRAALFLGAAALAVGGITAGAGAQSRGATAITPAEARAGAEAHAQLQQEFGAPMTGPQAQYVEQIGKTIAVQSSLANSRDAFTVTLLNSPVNNAFAIPGGYVYTTRQMVALMNNEAELAGVLGHEVAHIAARHSQRRQKAATKNSLLGIVGVIASSLLLRNSQLGEMLAQGIQQTTQMLTLKFSRNQELEADRLGIQYLRGAGYDPRAMSTVLDSLAQQNSLDARLQGRNDARLPEWASTHPDPASRVKTAASLAGNATGATNRDAFLTRIDGMTYGDSPEQGMIEGRQFIHPEFRLAFEAPSGFYMVNGTSAVSVNGQSGQAQLKTGPYSGDLERYVMQVYASLAQNQQLQPQSMERRTINGLPAIFSGTRVASGRSQVDVVVFAYEFSRTQAFHFVAITPAGRSGVFNPMFNSMRRISANEAAQVVPRVIDVVTVGRNDTVQSLSARMAYNGAQEQEARFRVLNGLTSNQALSVGQKVKLVVRAR